MSYRAEEYIQTEAGECGLACLGACGAMLGTPKNLAALRKQYNIGARGMTMQRLADIAVHLGFSARGVQCELEELYQLRTPAILHWDLNHFVVLEKASKTGLTIFDPRVGRLRLPTRDASRRFTGLALEVTGNPEYLTRPEPSRLSLFSLARYTRQLGSGLAQVLILSLLLQCYVLASPMYMRFAIDEAALKGDNDLLTALSLGFGAFAVFNVGADALRRVTLQRLNSLLSLEMTERLFHHLVRLPLPWFQRRRLADTLTRFQSLEPIKGLIANGLIAALIDGVLSVGTLVLMFVFSPWLALVAVAGFVAGSAIRFVSLPMMRMMTAKVMIATIEEQGARIETLRAIQTIKSMGGEAARESIWLNKFAATVRTTQKSAMLNIAFTSIQGIIDALTLIVTVFLGVKGVIFGVTTVGVLYAFISYRQQFLSRTQNLFDQLVNWRMLELYTHRLADIALSPQEEGLSGGGAQLNNVLGHLELRDVTYRYSDSEQFILQRINLAIEPGEFVAIIGPSGAGKSTLLKIVCGLYPPSSGEVRLDGTAFRHVGLNQVRRALGVVMQDDELLAGSISENVCFFDDDVDHDRVWSCLERAGLTEEVRNMPMGLDTLVGDMGSTLSGGQKQRVLLARALYRDPKILILDEATSHLDAHREAGVLAALSAMNVTRIVVTHRRETIQDADRILLLRDGGLIEIKGRKAQSSAQPVRANAPP